MIRGLDYFVHACPSLQYSIETEVKKTQFGGVSLAFSLVVN